VIRIAVSSFKGGTAKTSTALHLAAALATFHKKHVLLIDFDAQANLTAGLGLDPDAQDSLAPVLLGTKQIEQVTIPLLPHLDLIPADTWLERVETTGALAADRYSHEKLREILRSLHYDTIVIDTPPSLCWLTESALIASTHTLVCATPEFYSIKGLQRLSIFLSHLNHRHALEVLGIALSFWNSRGKHNQAFLEVIESTFPNRLLNTKIRRDVEVTVAAIQGKPIFETAPQSRAAKDYAALTHEILQRIGPVPPSLSSKS